jgi:hypothetical protein
VVKLNMARRRVGSPLTEITCCSKTRPQRTTRRLASSPARVGPSRCTFILGQAATKHDGEGPSCSTSPPCIMHGAVKSPTSMGGKVHGHRQCPSAEHDPTHWPCPPQSRATREAFKSVVDLVPTLDARISCIEFSGNGPSQLAAHRDTRTLTRQTPCTPLPCPLVARGVHTHKCWPGRPGSLGAAAAGSL